MYFMFFVAFVFLQSALSPWLEAVFGFASLRTGLVFFFIGAVSVFTQGVLLPPLGKRFDRPTLVLIGIVSLIFGLAVLAFVVNLWVLLVVAAISSFGFGIQFVTYNTLISVNTSEAAQGGTLGVAWAIAGLAQSIAPVLAITIFSFGLAVGFAGLAFLVSVAVGAATVPLLLAFRKAS
jgi:DHA1 family tetracycline resistance protein-like MFS transporter